MKKVLAVILLIAFAAPILGSSAYAQTRQGAQGQQGGGSQGSQGGQGAQGQQGQR